ncbi:helix-turn-helix transcriptional regulator [Actinoplanes sp. NEAU-A12]|uniref:Helix-turn-helix transcriptional regulator n=1 Tax=Actinoplanes sandaracinus TaxID=3045177 RepID=A0ABT6WXY6_9ACTN|nr:helix-turn-helix transcriptional regulator [Actinoplanes sandaracinus]MDI6104603.1 helix-turn-helix transcriptional regulator [Actinoplanes sandaracinus]
MAVPESVARDVSEAAAQARTPAEFGVELSRQVGRLVPHDGYQLRGLDPGTGVGCLVVSGNGYRAAAGRRLEINEFTGRDLHPLAVLIGGERRVGVLGTGALEERRSERLHDIMAEDGFGSELRVALVHAGVAWGALTLLRGSDCRPFSAAEAGHAQWLSAPLAVALKRFVAGRRPRPLGGHPTPGVVLVEADDTVRTSAATGRAWLGRLLPPTAVADDDALHSNLWNIVYAARRNGGEALTRIPTGGGWLAMHAQPLDGTVVVTIQPAAADVLLPALAAWYDITPSERAVLHQVRLGLPTKQIATRLRLSAHTVNDHLKSIYRKTGVAGRDELLAGLTG